MSILTASPSFVPAPPPLLDTLRAAPAPLPRRAISRSGIMLAIGGVVTVVNCLTLVAVALLGIG